VDRYVKALNLLLTLFAPNVVDATIKFLPVLQVAARMQASPSYMNSSKNSRQLYHHCSRTCAARQHAALDPVVKLHLYCLCQDLSGLLSQLNQDRACCLAHAVESRAVHAGCCAACAATAAKQLPAAAAALLQDSTRREIRQAGRHQATSCLNCSLFLPNGSLPCTGLHY
jgi:hypothetical protein